MWKVPCTHLPWLSCELQKHIGLSCFPYDFSCRHRLTESWSFQCLRALYDGNQWCQVLPWKGGRQCQHQKNLPLHWLTFSSGPYKRRKRQRLNGMRGHGSPVSGTVTAFVSGSLRYLLDREMGAFKGNGRSWLSQGTCSDREDVQTAMSQLLILREFGKERTLDHSQTAELCLTDIPQCRLLELEVSISACPAHTTALCLIWIYQSTELNAAREKGFWI